MEQPFDMSNLGAMLQQLGVMMQRAEAVPEGSVDWEGVHQAARAAIAQQPDPSVVSAEHDRVRAASELAQLWLDAVTQFPAASLQSAAWSRSEWLEGTFEGWKQVLTPIAQSMERGVAEMIASQEMPEEASAMMAPMLSIAKRMASVMSAQQVGQALGVLARDAWSTADIGLPLTSNGHTALVTTNTRAFAADHELDLRDLETYLALRDAAAQRLFRSTPWLAPRIRDAVAEYADGVHIDGEQMRELFSGLDLQDPAAMQAALQGSALELPMTAGQSSASARVELLITLIEGWVDHVAEAAHGGRIGSAPLIREALRRRRATGGPSERTFAQLLSLELRPRKLREASAYWAAMEPADRDATWRHPDFLPASLDEIG